MTSDPPFSLELVQPIGPQPWWLWWRGRLWEPRELQEPLRLCALDPAVLQEPAQFLVSPKPPRGKEPLLTLRKAISVGLRQLGASDPFLFFRPQDTESDWQLAGRLSYEFGCAAEPHALLQAQRRMAELRPLQTYQDPLRTAFLMGFTARFLEARKVPPCYCPLESPPGVFLQEVPLVFDGSPAQTPEPSGKGSQEREEAPPAARVGWLLFDPWRISRRFVVCFPPPAPEAVRISPFLDRPYPWW
jgi:hypothetical protein